MLFIAILVIISIAAIFLVIDVACIVAKHEFKKRNRGKSCFKPKVKTTYICKRNALNFCDKPKEVCCFCCDERDECNSWHCDEYDAHEYACDCRYAKAVEVVEDE